jgi:MFS family permease
MGGNPSESLMSPLYSLVAVLSSVFLLVSGNALVSVVAPVRASLDGFGDLAVGLLGSAYFAGMLAGALKTPALVRRVGHIRAFAAFVAVGGVAIDVLPTLEYPAAWLISRALVGFVLAGVYAIVESWINGAATNANRGALFAIYQIVNFCASSTGQLLMSSLDPRTFLPFTVGSAFYALSIVPLALTKADAPELPSLVRVNFASIRKLAPVSLGGAFIAGACNGASISLAPVYALQIGVAPGKVPLFTSAIVIGSALGVYPVGRLSDRVDRRLIMAVAMAAGAAMEIALAVMEPTGLPLIVSGFLVGFTTYTLYTLAASIANDGADAHEMVLISAGLLFVYCIAGIAAPAIASLAMRGFGPSALFWQNGVCHAALAIFAGAAFQRAATSLNYRRQ